MGVLAVAGASDWVDGYIAKNFNQKSVLGSYLDPLADKVLVASVTCACAVQGLLPTWLVGLFIGRDVVLVVGAFAHRAHLQGWRWRGWKEYFKYDDDILEFKRKFLSLQ